MTKFLNWDESIVEEFLRVAEEAIRRDAPGLSGTGVDRDIAAVKGADYSKIEESLRNTVGALQKRLTETEFALATTIEQEGEQRRLLIKRAVQMAQVCSERDALVDAHDELATSLNGMTEYWGWHDHWDGSRFYEASSDQ